MSGYCMCGAYDCRKCYPSDWWREDAYEQMSARMRDARSAIQRNGQEITDAEIRAAIRVLEIIAEADHQDVVDGIDEPMLGDLLDAVDTLAAEADDLRKCVQVSEDDFDPRRDG